MWLLRVNGVPGRVRGRLQTVANMLNLGKAYVLRLFADDISAAFLSHDKRDVMRLAHLPFDALKWA